MQIGTVSRLWLRGRSWRFKIHFWRNIVHFWKSHIRSNKLDVQETNCCFSQLNRIWNCLSGHGTETGWVAFSGTVGSDCFCSLEMFLVEQIERGNLWTVKTNLMTKSMLCMTLISNYEAVIKMILKGRSPTMRHVSRTLRVAFDWLFDRINLGSKFQIKHIDAKNQLADILTKGISHVMNGTICWSCLTSIVLAPLFASQRWQNELNKNQEKNVSQPNDDLWWIWPQKRIRSCLFQPHQTWRGLRMEINIMENLVQVTIERKNLWNRQDKITRKRITVDFGFVKCGKVEVQSTIDRGNQRKILGIHVEKLTLIVRILFSTGMRILQGTESLFTMEWGHLCWRISKNSLILKISSLHWRNGICKQSQRPSAKQAEKNVEHCSVLCRTFSNMGNVHGYDIECSDISGKEFLIYSKVLSWIKKVSPWNRCLTSQHKWSTMRKTSVVWTKFCMGRILGHNCHSSMTQQSSIVKAQKSM